MGRDRELEDEGKFGGEAIMLDAQPHVAAAVAEDCADDHGFREAGLLGRNRHTVILGGARWMDVQRREEREGRVGGGARE